MNFPNSERAVRMNIPSYTIVCIHTDLMQFSINVVPSVSQGGVGDLVTHRDEPVPSVCRELCSQQLAVGRFLSFRQCVVFSIMFLLITESKFHISFQWN